MRILLRGYKDPLVAVDPLTVLEHGLLGGNSGNLIFSEASYRALATATADITWADPHGRHLDADRVSEAYDAVVLPFANAFRPEFVRSLERWTAFIRRLRIPVTVLGVGAQSRLDYDVRPLAPIKAPVKAFVSAVLDRSPSIGVRGDFSNEYLRSLGFDAVTTIGCPSMFMRGALPPPRPTPGPLTPASRLAINLTPGVSHPGLLRRHLDRYPGLVYVPQSQAELRMMTWGVPAHVSDGGADYPGDLSHPVFGEDKARYFLDASTWVDFLAGVDFTFGSRIHGNIAALVTGGRAHVLVHDSRTRELSEYFEIPHTDVRHLAPDVDARDLESRSDPASVHRGHPARLERFCAYLEEHRLEHTLRGARSAPVDEALRVAALPGPVRSPGGPEQVLERVRWSHRRTTDRLDAVEGRLRRLERRSDADPDPRTPSSSPPGPALTPRSAMRTSLARLLDSRNRR